MKKILIVGLCVSVIITLFLFVQHEFDSICLNNRPYLSNRQQFMGVFYTNFDRFEKLVKDAAEGKDIMFQYNTNLDNEQVYTIFGHGELSEEILSLVRNAGMTNFQKDRHACLIYQYAPVNGSDVYIGVKYDYSKETWEYYYNHDYSSCRHNKIIYRLYDCMFNRKTLL